ncbi:Acetyltransferase [Sporomusa rhizae]|uniref:GNAT family N-acetyltransferase n=1 Tax=Sporomusa rhizae TaxID=357999 RepID=UPI00352A5047
MDWILQSTRLGFREIVEHDFNDLCAILQNIEVMYAWEHAFSDVEVREWIAKNLDRYANEGFSFFAAIEKNTQELVGVIGPLLETVDGVSYIGIGYIVNKNFWGKGYALEGANACMQFAFEALHAEKVIAQIRPGNLRSRKVAEKLGMKIEGEFTKQYRGVNMPHLIYSMERSVWLREG